MFLFFYKTYVSLCILYHVALKKETVGPVRYKLCLTYWEVNTAFACVAHLEPWNPVSMPGWRNRKNPRVRKWRNELAASAGLQWDSRRCWTVVTYCERTQIWLMYVLLYKLMLVHRSFFNSILHACLAANAKLSSTPSGLISIKQFVTWVCFAVCDKLYGKNFLKAFI